MTCLALSLVSVIILFLTIYVSGMASDIEGFLGELSVLVLVFSVCFSPAYIYYVSWKFTGLEEMLKKWRAQKSAPRCPVSRLP
jgi:hypothetical protein